ncbi:unnamed protein product [Closterium sp. Naga37s-1]|nr:unnamed protein product [Closterium sp. Naga37s-1]
MAQALKLFYAARRAASRAADAGPSPLSALRNPPSSPLLPPRFPSLCAGSPLSCARLADQALTGGIMELGALRAGRLPARPRNPHAGIPPAPVSEHASNRLRAPLTASFAAAPVISTPPSTAPRAVSAVRHFLATPAHSPSPSAPPPAAVQPRAAAATGGTRGVVMGISGAAGGGGVRVRGMSGGIGGSGGSGESIYVRSTREPSGLASVPLVPLVLGPFPSSPLPPTFTLLYLSFPLSSPRCVPSLSGAAGKSASSSAGGVRGSYGAAILVFPKPSFFSHSPPCEQELLASQPAAAQAAYGATILAFLGGPHWGLAMARYAASQCCRTLLSPLCCLPSSPCCFPSPPRCSLLHSPVVRSLSSFSLHPAPCPSFSPPLPLTVFYLLPFLSALPHVPYTATSEASLGNISVSAARCWVWCGHSQGHDDPMCTSHLLPLLSFSPVCEQVLGVVWTQCWVWCGHSQGHDDPMCTSHLLPLLSFSPVCEQVLGVVWTQCWVWCGHSQGHDDPMCTSHLLPLLSFSPVCEQVLGVGRRHSLCPHGISAYMVSASPSAALFHCSPQPSRHRIHRRHWHCHRTIISSIHCQLTINPSCRSLNCRALAR